jgi:hypothetical protein
MNADPHLNYLLALLAMLEASKAFAEAALWLSAWSDGLHEKCPGQFGVYDKRQAAVGVEFMRYARSTR